MELSREVALKVLQTVDAGLVRGVGKPVPGQMCVEAAVCFALHDPAVFSIDLIDGYQRVIRVAALGEIQFNGCTDVLCCA